MDTDLYFFLTEIKQTIEENNEMLKQLLQDVNEEIDAMEEEEEKNEQKRVKMKKVEE